MSDIRVTTEGKNPTIANICREETQIATIHGLTRRTDIENMGTDITRYKNDGDSVIVIFDADTNENAGGFAVRQKQIKDYELSLDDDIFLFPDNKNDGALEDLLENIINTRNQSIFDCWGKYEACLQVCASKKIGRPLTTPAKKSKIYSYLEVLLGTTDEEKKKIKDPNRDYTETDHWDLDSACLEPLKCFLFEKIKQQ
jgi:hypothetical protein